MMTPSRTSPLLVTTRNGIFIETLSPCRAKYFRQALTGKFAESNSKTLDLDGYESPSAVGAWLEYLYRGDYVSALEGEWGRREGDDEPNVHIKFHIDVYVVADKYQQKGLAEMATELFCRSCAHNYWTVEQLNSVVSYLYQQELPPTTTYRNALLCVAVGLYASQFDGEKGMSLLSSLPKDFAEAFLARMWSDKIDPPALRCECFKCKSKFSLVLPAGWSTKMVKRCVACGNSVALSFNDFDRFDQAIEGDVTGKSDDSMDEE